MTSITAAGMAKPGWDDRTRLEQSIPFENWPVHRRLARHNLAALQVKLLIDVDEVNDIGRRPIWNLT